MPADPGLVQLLGEFGRTAAIGDLHPGASLRSLAELYGPPISLGRVSKGRRWPHRFAYGDVELTGCICRRVLHVSIPTHLSDLQIVATGQSSTGRFACVFGPDEIRAALLAAGASWSELRRDTNLTLRSDANVEFVFWDVDGVPQLHSTGTDCHRHECISPEDAVTEFAVDFLPES